MKKLFLLYALFLGLFAGLSPSGLAKDKFSLWQEPSYFRGAAIDLFFPCREENSLEKKHSLSRKDFLDLRSQGANTVFLCGRAALEVLPPYKLDETMIISTDNGVSWAAEAGLYVILHMEEGPGVPEKEREGKSTGRELARKKDMEIKKWEELWTLMAKRYKDKANVVAYDLMIGPYPEESGNSEGWTREWNATTKRLTTAIRKEDKDTPIIVSSPDWGSPEKFPELLSTGDRFTVYSFQMFEPYGYTHQGFNWAGSESGPLFCCEYPGSIRGIAWDKRKLQEFLTPVTDFQEQHPAPIFVRGFGCNRAVPSGPVYINDVSSVFEANGWDYAYWAWRSGDGFDLEKDVDGKDLEVGRDSSYMEIFKRLWAKNRYFSN